jgi:uncharacterized protein YrrD
MELKEGTRVYSADGKEVGEINRFVVNPVTKKVSHIVVQKGAFFPEDRVVPIEWLNTADPDRVTLMAQSGSVSDLPPFEETHYVSIDPNEAERFAPVPYGEGPAYYWNPSFGTPALGIPATGAVGGTPGMVRETDQNIPDDTVALKEGARVISDDDETVGSVERLLTDPRSNRVTHFVVSQGLLMKERKMVPVDWVRLMEEDKVHLAVGKGVVDRLPEYRETGR